MNSVKMIIGNDCVLDNSDLFEKGEKALIVTGKNSAFSSGAFDDVAFNLTLSNIGYEVFSGIKQNPSVSSCIEAAKFGYDNSCDFIIGIGGGSVLDAAKTISLCLTNQSIDEDGLYKKNWKNKRAPLILVGTTAGTGSEITNASVLTNKNDRKKSISDAILYADVAFGDPRYTYSLNRDFTISTALDALCHCVESYLSNNANDVSRNYAIKGIKLLYPVLLHLIDNDILDAKQRENLYRGSIEAGYAIDITKTTFAHRIGYFLTEEHKIPHGYACAFFLEDILSFQEENSNDYYVQFLKDIELSKEDLSKLFKLIPSYDIHLTKKEIEEIIPRWLNDSSIVNTHGNMNQDDVEQLLIKHFI